MKLYSNCKSCQHTIGIRSFASTRSDLEMSKGEILQLNCNSCGKQQERHVNDVKAKPNRLILVVGGGLGVVIAVLLWIVLGAIGTLSVIVPFLVWRQQEMAVRTFNGYRVKETKKARF